MPTGEGGWPEGHPQRWSILVALCAALLLIVIDTTVANVAVPAIAREFGASTAALQAVIDAYVIVFAGLLVAAGVASDRFGRRRTVLVGLIVFGLASASAVAAWSVWWLIVMRALMGVGAALIMPATLAVLVHVFHAAERPKAFAIWAAVAAVAMAAGPALGGFLVAAWSWAGVFVINVPVVAVALIGIARLVPETRDTHARRLDPLATALITLGMVALITVVITAGKHGLTGTLVVTCAVITAAALAGFGWRQHRAATPMVEFGLYRNRQFAGASAAAALLTLGTGSGLFILTQYLQLVLGYSAFKAGLAIMPLAGGTVLGSTAGGRAPVRLGARWSIAIGFVVTAVGFGVLATLTPTSSYGVVATGLLLGGAGTGFASPATTSTVLGAVPRDRAGMGSALNDTHQQLGTAFGIAALGSLLAMFYRADLPAAVPPESRDSLPATLAYAAHQPAGAEITQAAHAAFTHAQSVTMLVAAASALTGAAIALAVLHPDAPRRAVEARPQQEGRTK